MDSDNFRNRRLLPRDGDLDASADQTEVPELACLVPVEIPVTDALLTGWSCEVDDVNFQFASRPECVTRLVLRHNENGQQLVSVFSIAVETATEIRIDVDFGDSKLRLGVLGQHDWIILRFGCRSQSIRFALSGFAFGLKGRDVSAKRSDRLFLVPDAGFQQLDTSTSSPVAARRRCEKQKRRDHRAQCARSSRQG